MRRDRGQVAGQEDGARWVGRRGRRLVQSVYRWGQLARKDLRY